MIEYNTVKAFANASPDLYNAFKQYADDDMARRGVPGKSLSGVSVDVMEKAINKEFALELERRTGYSVEKQFDGSVQRYANNMTLPNILSYFVIMTVLFVFKNAIMTVVFVL